MKSLKKTFNRIFSIVISIGFITTMLPISSMDVFAANDKQTTSIMTDYKPTINEVTDSAGFVHPGVGLTKELLENVRDKIRTNAEPWSTYFNVMLQSSSAATNVSSSNVSGADPTKPNTTVFNSQGVEHLFIQDGLKSYTQALMYFITGNEVYRTNAMKIIRIWSQMEPSKYAVYTDCHIHAAVPLYRMVMAAEILRYTSCQTASLAWTDKDTTDFTNNLVTPVMNVLFGDQNHFMNQHNYPLLGFLAGYIFTGNKTGYDKSVEWTTVNSTAKDQGFNGAIKQLFRWVTEEEKPGEKVGEGTPVEPHVQHMEMGRDQAHAGGDLQNMAMLGRIFLSQGTKVDPKAGTVSTADNAVSFYEFLNNRLLAAGNYFWQFMLGYDTPWTPQAYAISSDGTIRDTYNFINNGYRGRYGTAAFWDFYSYYTYVKHEDVSKLAPYYYEAFSKKPSPTVGDWDSVDAAHDFWLYLPPEAEKDASAWLPQDKSTSTIHEIAECYTKFDNNANTVKEGDTSFVRMNATETGTKIDFLNSNLYTSQTYGLRIRTNSTATLKIMGQSVLLPNTNNKWVYFPVIGAPGDLCEITVIGSAGTTVDIDNINSTNELTPPVFNSGGSDLKLYTYVGADINVDFSAKDAGSTDVITYGVQNNPAGSAINSNTGAFSWKPTADGDFSFVITAFDGTTVSTKKVNLVVGKDRAAAVQNITALYDKNQIYTQESLDKYNTVLSETMKEINTASDENFDKQLQTLRSATEGLELVTPLAKDGTLLWSSAAAYSSWGTYASNMDDCDVQTGGYYGLALGTAPNLYHVIDFGTDFKVSADKFGFQSNIFADRLANSTVYGSNDGENWTRLTPGVTQFTQAYQTLDVDPLYKNEKYRYIKLQMIKPLPDVLYGVVRNFLELQEFRIYGTRYEIGNKIKAVSITSDQSVNNKVSTGDTVKLSITTKEPIKNLTAKIQGVTANVTTEDNINWTASAILNENVQTGPIKFSIDYQKEDGSNGDTIYAATDNSSLFLVNGTKFINVPMLAKVTASDKQWTGNGLSKDQVGNLLFDGDTSTYGDLNTASGSYYTVDFGEGAAVNLDEIVLMPRPGVQALSSRMNGLIIQGSNDDTNWTDITKPVTGTIAGTWMDIKSDAVLNHENYRYLRLYNSSAWSGDVAEVEFYGNYNTSAANLASKITSIVAPTKVASSLTLPKVPNGYSLTIKSTGNDGIIGTNGTITQPDQDTLVPVVLEVTKVSDGTTADTQNINVLVSGKNQAPKIDVTKLAVVTASADQWTKSGSGGLTKDKIGYLLFDGDTSTAGDLKVGAGSYYTVDFGDNAAVKLNEIKLMPRTGNSSRLNGVIIQGSNDNQNWTDITAPITGAQDNTWIDVRLDKILNQGSYRYLKIYNSSGWFGNAAEVEFYGDLIQINKVKY